MKKIIFKYSFILFASMLNAQNNPTFVPKIAPSTPETAKFNQFIDTPVGYNTGIPNIDINLGQIDIDGVSVPISLSYHADGIKVDEKATWVGLGWNLNAGYKVTRKENGIPDERRLFWQTDQNSLTTIQGIKNYSDNNIVNSTNPNWTVIAHNLSQALDKYNTNIDVRPDEFNYSTSNSGGKFMFSQLNQKFITFPLNMDKINLNYQIDVINNVKITDDKGIKYFYGMDNNSRERINPLTHDFFTAWNVSEIENVKNEKISFLYNLFSLQIYEKPLVYLENAQSYISNSEQLNLESSYISEINYPEGKIEFIIETNREDLKQFPKLQSIIFKNNLNQIIKTIIFNYSYFTNSIGNISSDNFTENSGKRLRLDSVDLYNSTNSEKQSYTFTYYDTDIPDRLKGGSDYWGYYNGTIENGVPSYVKYGETIVEDENPNNMEGYFLGANKNINSQKFNTFLLKSIAYPTGAKQEYVYESNFGKLSNNSDQTFFCLANKYLPVNQHLENYNFSINGYFGQNYSNGIYFGYPQPSEIVTLNQYEKKYIFKKNIPINNNNIKSIGTLYTNSLSHNFDKTALGVTNASQLNMRVEEKRFLVKNGVRTFISGPGLINTGLLNNQKPIFFYGINLLNDNYDTFEIEVSFIYNTLLTPQLNNKPFYFTYNFDDIKRDSNQFYNNNVYLIGGARIKEVNIIDNNSLIKKRIYKYSDDFSESGLAYFIPTFSERRLKKVYVDSDHSAYSAYRMTSSVGVYNTSNGSNVAYQHIDEQIYGVNNSYLGKTSYDYFLSQISNDSNYISFNANPYAFINTYDWVNKSLMSKRIFNAVDNINPLIQEDYEYYFKKTIGAESVDEFRNDLAIDDIIMVIGNTPDYLNSFYYTYNTSGDKRIPYFKHFEGFSLPKRKVTTENLNGNSVVNTTVYEYNFSGDLLQLTNESTTSSTNQSIEKKYFYPNDLPLEPNMTSIIAANRIGEPIRNETYKNGVKISEQKTQFGIYNSDVVGQNLILPQYILAKKGNDTDQPNLENKITFDSYDTKGNITQYTLENGTAISIIWGYNKTQPIAKIENATNAQVQTALGMNLSDISEANMSTINALRSSLPNAMISTYTHIPLVGVSTITDPKGDTITYIYDSFNRLKEVKDKNGNKLSENQYHYRP